MKKKLFFAVVIISILSLHLTRGYSQEPVFSPPPGGAVTPQPATQGKISLDIKGMDIVDTLKMLAMRAGINIVMGKNVTGRVTLLLKDVNVWDAFEIVVLANDLAYEKKGEIINVITQKDYELQYGERYQDRKEAKIIKLKYTKAMDLSRALNQVKSNIGRIVVDEGSNTIALIDTPEKIKELESFIESADMPIRTRVFNLNYAQADKLQPKIQESLTKGVGNIKIDERTNKIAITDYPAKLEEIAKIIKAFDEKTAQVLIDAQIIEITPSDTFEMGVDWDYWIEKHLDIRAALPVGTANRLLLGTSATAPTEKGEYKTVVDLLRTIGDTKILSSPRIMAINNQEAKILVGKKDAYITSSSSQAGDSTVTSQSVSFVDVGIKLYVTPTINRDGFITMKIKPEISSAERTSITSDGKVTQIPIVTTSEAETSVIVKDGVTIIIGGLTKDQKTKTVKKIPLLGDIPGLGLFFKSTSDALTKTELVILLTPHIVSGEVSYTDFSEMKPKDGVVMKMDKGDIVSERIKEGYPEPAKEAPKEATKEASQVSAEEKLVEDPRKEAIQKEALKEAELKEAMKNFSSREEPAQDDGFEYYQLLSAKVKELTRLGYPKNLMRGEIKVVFTLSKDGVLRSGPYLFPTDNSKFPPFALWALVKAIKSASPFPPFPRSFKEEEETFDINLSY